MILCSKPSYQNYSLYPPLYPDITIFSVILWPYRYIGSFDITILRYNDIILLLPWHIVISGFNSTVLVMALFALAVCFLILDHMILFCK